MIPPVIPENVLEVLTNPAIWVADIAGKAIVGQYAKDIFNQVLERLRRKNPDAKEALKALEEDQNLDVVSDLPNYLRNAMKNDPELQKLVAELGQELEAAKNNVIAAQKQDMTVEAGGTGYQSQSTGTTFVGGDHTHHHGSDQH